MNTMFRQLSIALLAASATVAFAASDAPAAQRVEVTAPRAALTAAEVVMSERAFDTSYKMSTGQNMAVSSFGDGVRLQYGRHMQATLHYDGNGSFVSRDGQLSLVFELDRDGEPSAVRLTMPAHGL